MDQKSQVNVFLIYCLPQRQTSLSPPRRVLPETKKSRSSSTTGFSKSVVVKIKHGHSLKYYCFETSNTKRNSRGMLNRFRWQRGCVEGVSSHQQRLRFSFQGHVYTCLSILLATFDYRFRGTCVPTRAFHARLAC